MEDQFNLETLPEDHKEALKEFKKRFEEQSEEYLHNDHFMLDWLIARKYDINAAEEMLKNHLRFRKALGQDDPNYRNYKVPDIGLKYYPHGHFGYDKQGRPMCYSNFGNIDNKGLLCNMKTSDLWKGLFWHQECWKWYCEEASSKLGKRIHQANCVMDLTGLGTRHLWKPGMQMFLSIVEMLQQHCPEVLHKIYVINAPTLFPTFYKMVRPILDINTQNKVLVLGDDFLETLLQDIDADQLPTHYGGTGVDEDGDPKCSKHICYGGDVPLELYYKRPETSEENLTEITIANGKQMLIACKVEKPGSVISWYFEFDPYYDTFDIGFALYRKYNDQPARVSEMEMVVPYFRLFCGYVPESGEYVADQMGTYVVQFDNSYSWVNSKVLKYRIEVDKVLVK